MAQANKKVLQAVNTNKLTVKDIRTRDKYWYKPFELEDSYLDLICYTGWECWKKNYKFLPLPSVWEEIQGGKARRGVVAQLDNFVNGYRSVVDALPLRERINYYDIKHEQERIKELTERALKGREYEQTNGKGSITIPLKDKSGQVEKTIELNKYASFRLMEFFVVRNTNNTLTILTKNTRQLDFNRPDIVFFFRGNKWTSKAKTNKEARMMYWVSSFDYVNDLKGWVQLTLEKDNFWQYWGNAANSRGKAQIISSQLGTTHNEHKEDYHQQNEEYCRACDLCYDFCGDLRNKRAVPVGYVNPSKAKWQPQWKILSVATGQAGVTSGLAIPDDEGGSPLIVPTSIHPVRYIIQEGQERTQIGASPTLFFLVDKEHHTLNKGQVAEDTPISKAIHKPSKGEDYWEDLPQCYAEQPHLLNHSSAQFYFQKKLLFTANLKHLKVRKAKGGSGRTGIAQDGLKFQLGYHILVRSSLSGILYNFESGDIFYKWELKVEGSEQSMGAIDRLIGIVEKFFGADDNSLSNFESEAGKGSETSLTNPFGFITGLIKMAKMAGVAWLKKQIQPDWNNIMDAKKYKEKTGLKEDKTKSGTDKSQAQSEEQTKRQKASTARAMYRAVEPSIFYSNTISFSYGFFEFANRTINNPFMIRFEHSNLLYDNLVNNNSNPVQQFTVNNFSQLKQLLTEGEWQGQVELFDFPLQGFFERILTNTTFYKDLSEYFKPWQPKFKTLQSFTYGDTSNMDIPQGREEMDVEEIKRKEKTTEELLSADMTEADYGVSDYIGADSNLWPELNRVNNNEHPELTPEGIMGNCLGCLCGGGSHDNPDYNFERTYNFTTGGTIYLKTRGSGAQNCPVPAQGGKVIFWAKGNSGGITLITEREWTEKNYKFNFKFDRIEVEKEQEMVGIDYNEPTFMPTETELDLDIDMEVDIDKEEMDMDEDFGDKDLGETEQDEDWDKDLDKDIDVDKDEDEEQDLDDDIDVDLDKDSDTDEDIDSDKDKDKDQDKDDDRDKDDEEDIDRDEEG